MVAKPPPPTRFGPQAPARPVAQPAGKAGGGFKITVGSYLHQGPGKQALPPDIAGHSFVAIQGPGGKRETWGFSPAGPVDPRSDIGKLRGGVKGRVHADDNAFAKPGVRTRTFEVGAAEARAALAKVAEYRVKSPQFSLANRQCATFATDVLRAAHVDAFPGAGVRPPHRMYAQLGASQAPKPKRK